MVDIDDTLIQYTSVFLRLAQKEHGNHILNGFNPYLPWSDLYNYYLDYNGISHKREELLRAVDAFTERVPYYNFQLIQKIKTECDNGCALRIITARHNLDTESKLYKELCHTFGLDYITPGIKSGKNRIFDCLDRFYSLRDLKREDSIHFYDDNEQVQLSHTELSLLFKRFNVDINPEQIHFHWVSPRI